MKEYTDKEIMAAVIIQKNFRKYLEDKKREEEWINKLMNEQPTNADEEILAEHDRQELQEFLRDVQEQFSAREETLKETYENLGLNVQTLSAKLENTARELNDFYSVADADSSPLAYDLCEEIDNHISKIKEIILLTSAEISNATNKLAEKQKDVQEIHEMIDVVNNALQE